MKDARTYVSAFVPNDGGQNANPPDIYFSDLVAEDFATHGRDLFSQGFWALFWHRFGNLRMSVKARVLRAPLTVIYRVMSKLTEWMAGIYLPYTVVVGRRVRLEHFGGMILVANRIGDDVIIRQNTTFGVSSLKKLQERPDIGSRVEVGAGAVLIGGIEIGSDVIIGANAVVVRSLPPGVVAGGVPARVIRKRSPELGDA